MKRLCLYVIAVSFVMAVSARSAEAITYYGSNGLLRVSSANNVYEGALWGSFNFSFNQGVIRDGDPENYYNGRGAINLVYGLRKYLEVGLSQVAYQDRPVFGNPGPGPLRISIKGSIPRSRPTALNFGAQIIGLLPTGWITNAEHESYYSDQPSIGGMLVVSWDSNPVDIGRSKRLHFNIGYMFHNDKNLGQISLFSAGGVANGLWFFGDEDPEDVQTKQILFGAALEVPLTRRNTVFAEISGEHFVQYNPYIIPARLTITPFHYYRLAPGVKTQLNDRITFQSGVELNINPSGDFNLEGADISIYPAVKFFASIQYRIREGLAPAFRRGRSMRILGGSYYGFGRRGTTGRRGMGPGVIENIDEREELLDQVERDLQEIREQRIEAQRELEELRRAVEEEPDR